MTKALSYLLLFLSVVPLFGQTGFEAIDSASQKVPKGLKTADEIALYLTKDLKKEDEKVRAIYIWVTHNIQYDMAQIRNPITYTEQINIADEALKNRKGVCEHYAQLFHKMCSTIGITSYVISGYTRQSDGDKIDPLNHAWNGVVVNNSYFLVDPTWDAGYFNKGIYKHEFQDDFFLVEPEKFLKTHMPFDPIWQFLNYPITHIEFNNKDYSDLNERGNFAFRDSIAIMAASDTIATIEKSNQRIRKFGVTNAHIREELIVNENLLEYYRYNSWVSRFNAINGELKLAVDEINLAVAYHNKFFRIINKKQSNSQGEGEEIKTNLDKAGKYITKGQELLNIAKSQLESLEYLGKNKDHLQHAKTNKKKLLDYIFQLEQTVLKLEPSIKKNLEFYNE
ncbi:hypothetical protein OO009_02100 [Flavobacteriaceae bacterium KMM 6897]|nr:hypothetical protein [Flavobacteriaceae bacterium KMM 6897]